MSKSNEAESALPRVSRAVLDVLLRDAEQEQKEGRIAEAAQLMYDRMRDENPDMRQLLVAFASYEYGGANSECGRAFLYGAVLTYDALRRQAEVDTIERHY